MESRQSLNRKKINQSVEEIKKLAIGLILNEGTMTREVKILELINIKILTDEILTMK